MHTWLNLAKYAGRYLNSKVSKCHTFEIKNEEHFQENDILIFWREEITFLLVGAGENRTKESVGVGKQLSGSRMWANLYLSSNGQVNDNNNNNKNKSKEKTGSQKLKSQKVDFLSNVHSDLPRRHYKLIYIQWITGLSGRFKHAPVGWILKFK